MAGRHTQRQEDHMNPTDRARTITNITTAATWLNTHPHHINDIITELHRQATASATIRTNNNNRSPKGSHSDPTSQAVITTAQAKAHADKQTREIDATLTLIDQTLHRLLTECANIQRSGLQPTNPPTQPQRIRCTNCARFGLDIDTDDAGGRLCTKCKHFRKNHKVIPHEAICRSWANGHNRITPGLIAEAKAHSQAKRNKRRTP